MRSQEVYACTLSYLAPSPEKQKRKRKFLFHKDGQAKFDQNISIKEVTGAGWNILKG